MEITTLLAEQKEKFSILTLIENTHLSDWKRTAFTWTELGNSVCLAMNKSYFQEALSNSNITGIIAPPLAVLKCDQYGKTIVVAHKAAELFYFIHNLALHRHHTKNSQAQERKTFIHPSAKIAASTLVGKNVSIGRNVIIHEKCIIHDCTVIGDNCVLFDNVTIGVSGFFSKEILGKKTHVQHFGGVRLGENCLIHACTNIGRSVNAGEFTELADNVHIGNQSNIGHDCKIGRNTDISSNVILAGRVKIGCDCWLGAGCIISNAISIGDACNVRIGAVVIENVDKGKFVSGNFALSHTKHLMQFKKQKKEKETWK